MKLSIIVLLSLIISSCGGSGGGSNNGPSITYAISFTYPENPLAPGQGVLEVRPTGAVCRDSKGADVAPSFCEGIDDIDLTKSPAITYKSPAGPSVIQVDNSTEGEVTIEFSEGEAWTEYSDVQKKEAVDGKITCLAGFDLTYRGSCEAFTPSFLYGEFPVNDMLPCSGSKTISRTFECISNITGIGIDLTECSHLTLEDSTMQFSPEGSSTLTLANGDTSLINCQVGKTGDDIGSGSTVISSVSCGENRHLSESYCEDDVFVAESFFFETLNLQPGDGIVMANATGVNSCVRQHDGATVDSSLCDMPTAIPQQEVLSPAGEIQLTLPNSMGPVNVTVVEGQTWDDLTVAEKVSQLENQISCWPGFQLSYQAECEAPTYTEVLGDYPANELSFCEGTKDVLKSHQCFYNITGTLMDGSYCTNTSEEIQHKSPAGNKEVVHLNGDVVILSCAEGALETEGTITSYVSCGENRFKDNGICINDSFVPEFEFTDPMLAVGDGEVEVSATGIKECRRESDNVIVSNSLCEIPAIAPKKTFLSPAGEITYTNSLFDSNIISLNEGETPSDNAPIVRNLSCGRHRISDGETLPCRNLNIVQYDACGSLGFVFLHENGNAFSAGVTPATLSENVATVKTFLDSKSINKVMCTNNMFFAYNPSTKQVIKWGVGTPVTYSNVEGVYESRYAVVISKTNNSLEIIHNEGITAGTLPIIPHTDIKDVRCFRLTVTSSSYRSGCVILKNDGTLVGSGTPADYLVTYAVERSSRTATNITNISTSILSGTYDAITESLKGDLGGDYGVIFHGIGTTPTKGIGATMVLDYGVNTGGGPASVPANLSNIKFISPSKYHSFTAVDANGDHYFWGSRTDILNVPTLNENAVQAYFWDSLVFYENGTFLAGQTGNGFSAKSGIVFDRFGATGEGAEEYWGIADGDLHIFSRGSHNVIENAQDFITAERLYLYKDSTGKWTNPSYESLLTTIQTRLNPHLHPLSP